jgi:tagatose 6-phosphate kinase
MIGSPGSGAGTAGDFPVIRRLVCVCPNAAIDKIVAVDRLRPGTIHRPEVLSVLPGGKGVNVARAAARLGLRSSVVAVLAGHAGDWIAEELAGRGIPVRSVRVAGESRTCLSILDREEGALTELYEPGVALDTGGWSALESALRAELADDASGALLVLSGSLLPGSPPDGYRLLAELAARTGALVAVDAGGSNLAAALAARPWLVKINSSEATAATSGAGTVTTGTGDEEASISAAKSLLADGAGMALITRGVRGAVLVGRSGSWRVGPPPELGRFAVGSGDAFLAGFASAVSKGCELSEAARRAASIGAANALNPGQAEFDLADVARLLKGIAVERID